MKLWRGVFANICQCGNTWHASLASDACMAHLGPQTKHLTEFRDPDARFESLGTQAKSRDKFGDLGCNLLLNKSKNLTCSHDLVIKIYQHDNLSIKNATKIYQHLLITENIYFSLTRQTEQIKIYRHAHNFWT